MADDEVMTLEQASKGLLYPSESDEPFAGVALGGNQGESVETLIARIAGGRKVEEVGVEQFFGELQVGEDGEGFRELRRSLESQLTALRIFRVGSGEVEVDVYLIGRGGSGRWVGLKTKSVET